MVEDNRETIMTSSLISAEPDEPQPEERKTAQIEWRGTEVKLEHFEIKEMIGKGAFGNAVLYRRKDDGLMCIIKEINMLDLNANDRQMALNEVKVLSKMDHPNIVGKILLNQLI